MNAGVMEIACRLPLIAAMLTAAAYSVVLARATYLLQLGTEPSIHSAIQLVPFDAAAYTALDSLQPEPTPKLLNRSLELNPYQSAVLIRLGLYAELNEANRAKAEQYYRRAAEIDRMTVPVATLANFYARRRDTKRFFDTARYVFSITPTDSRPLLFEARMLANTPADVIAILPDRQRVLFEYLSLLLSTEDPTLLKDVALKAVSKPINLANLPADLSDFWLNVIGTTEDRLLQAARTNEATEIWAAMHKNGWAAAAPPSPAAPITNGSFEHPISGHGFDWSFAPNTGIVHEQYPTLNRLTFVMDGTQPEACRLMAQFIPVEGGRAYRMSWQADSNELRGAPGLKWRIYSTTIDRASDKTVLTGPEFELSTGAADGSWQFTAPQSWKSAVVSLEYERPFGQSRAEGSVNLRRIALIPVSSTATSHPSGGS